MSETPWTPGPWEYTGGDVWVDGRELVCCGRRQDECCGEPDVRAGQDLIAQTSEQNAPLIAAAPELAEALQRIVAAIDASEESIGSLHCVQLARAALAKAKGLQETT